MDDAGRAKVLCKRAMQMRTTVSPGLDEVVTFPVVQVAFGQTLCFSRLFGLRELHRELCPPYPSLFIVSYGFYLVLLHSLSFACLTSAKLEVKQTLAVLFRRLQRIFPPPPFPSSFLSFMFFFPSPSLALCLSCLYSACKEKYLSELSGGKNE